jgi:hypothetical protein
MLSSVVLLNNILTCFVGTSNSPDNIGPRIGLGRVPLVGNCKSQRLVVQISDSELEEVKVKILYLSAYIDLLIVLTARLKMVSIFWPHDSIPL